MCARGSSGDSAEQLDIRIDVLQSARAHGQEIQALLKKFADGLLFIRHGADDEGWLERNNIGHGFHVPAIPDLRQTGNRRDVAAPLGDAHE